MKFVIRDDDLNYFSTPADIERWYADIFAAGIPVGFSAIPFVKPISDVYSGTHATEDKEYPIHLNAELVSYVKGNPHIEILQHGTTHETRNGIFEYGRESGLEGETVRGKEELEQAFGTRVRVFVPPHDRLSRHGIRSVEEAGLDIIRGYEVDTRHTKPRLPHDLLPFARMELHRLRHFRDPKRPSYPYVLDFGIHKEACSYRLEHETAFDGLAYTHQKQGVFVIVTHLHMFTEEKKERLLRLIEKAQELGAQLVFPQDLFKDEQARDAS